MLLVQTTPVNHLGWKDGNQGKKTILVLKDGWNCLSCRSPGTRECGGPIEAEMSVQHQPNPHYRLQSSENKENTSKNPKIGRLSRGHRPQRAE